MSTDERIQKDLERGKDPLGDDHDIKAYQHIFSALKNEPEFSLPANFADQVVGAAVQKQKKNTFREYFWFGIGMFLLVIAFATAIFITDFKLSAGIFSGLRNFQSLLIFGVFFIAALHWLDKRLLKNKQKVF